MNFEDANRVKEYLSSDKPILLVPHKNPDGDAIGACLGLWHFLKARGLDAIVVAPNDFPVFLKWMPGADQVRIFEKETETCTALIAQAGLIFTLDFNALDRSGGMEQALGEAGAPLVMIDHHQAPDDYAAVRYSDAAMSSTCEMIYHTIAALDGVEEIGPEIADCLYTGLLTDTGSFKYAATTPTTLRIAAELMERGAAHTAIHRHIYDTNRPERLKLLGRALGNLHILKPFRTAYITLSQQELDACDFRKGDTEGFVNYALSLENVVLAAIFIENRDEGIVKISLRSQGDFSVNELARTHFGGGGHTNAAGGRSTTSLQETARYFESILSDYKDQLHKT